MTLEMEHVAYGRPAADAFDLPQWLARRERRAVESRPAPADGAAPAEQVTTGDALPPEFVPWAEN